MKTIEIISKSALMDDDVVNGMEEVLLEVIIPYLESPSDILFSRACSVISQYGAIGFSDNKSIQNICKGAANGLTK